MLAPLSTHRFSLAPRGLWLRPPHQCPQLVGTENRCRRQMPTHTQDHCLNIGNTTQHRAEALTLSLCAYRVSMLGKMKAPERRVHGEIFSKEMIEGGGRAFLSSRNRDCDSFCLKECRSSAFSGLSLLAATLNQRKCLHSIYKRLSLIICSWHGTCYYRR